MDENQKRRFAAAFDANNQLAQRLSAAASVAENNRRANLFQFEGICRDIIRPAMDDVGVLLRDNGHDFKVSRQEFRPSSGSAPVLPEKIEMTILLRTPSSIGHRSGPAHHPHVAVLLMENTGVVWFHVNSVSRHGGGVSGSDGEMPMSAVTKDTITEKILQVVEAGLKA